MHSALKPSPEGLLPLASLATIDWLLWLLLPLASLATVDCQAAVVLLFFVLFFKYSITPFLENLDCLTWAKLQQLQEYCYPFLPVVVVQYFCVPRR